MRRIFLLSSVLLAVPFMFGEMGEVSAQCVATTDCASLGYTEASCPNGGIKCPFGNTWSCKENSCDRGENNPDCTYGSIYYSDGTCIKEFVSGRIPIGVVVYVDEMDKQKWIMALDIATYSDWTWLAYEDIDVPEIENYTLERTAVSDLKSCENTDAMIKSLGESAARKVREYAPEGATDTKGKWCLPSAGIWNMINNHRAAIDAGIARVKGTAFDCVNCVPGVMDKKYKFYWSSSEGERGAKAWHWDAASGKLKQNYKYWNSSYDDFNSSLYLRPVMKI